MNGDAKRLAVVSSDARLVELQPAGDLAPFFMVGSFAGFVDVVRLLENERPVLSLVADENLPQIHDYSLEAEAAYHIQTILKRQSRGPFLIGGYSARGLVAFEIAQQLVSMQHEVGLLVMFDTPNWEQIPRSLNFITCMRALAAAVERIRFGQIPGSERVSASIRSIKEWFRRTHSPGRGISSQPPAFDIPQVRISAARAYRPTPYYGRVLLIRRRRALSWQWRALGMDLGWREVLPRGLEIGVVNSSDHANLFDDNADRVHIAERLRDSFRSADSRNDLLLAEIHAVKF